LSPLGSLIFATGTGKVLVAMDSLKTCVIGNIIRGSKILINFRGIPSSPTAFDLIDRIAFLITENETVRKTKESD
jgi:hypothetical protein